MRSTRDLILIFVLGIAIGGAIANTVDILLSTPPASATAEVTKPFVDPEPVVCKQAIPLADWTSPDTVRVPAGSCVPKPGEGGAGTVVFVNPDGTAEVDDNTYCGDIYNQCFVEEYTEDKYGHPIDPTTGKPITN